MKIISKKLAEVEYVEDIICNRCGKSCKNEVGDFDGLIEAEVIGGFYSPKIEDGTKISFSLCEHCVADLVQDFKIPPKGDRYL